MQVDRQLPEATGTVDSICHTEYSVNILVTRAKRRLVGEGEDLKSKQFDVCDEGQVCVLWLTPVVCVSNLKGRIPIVPFLHLPQFLS